MKKMDIYWALTGKKFEDFLSSPRSLEEGKMKFALLKENFDYRNWFEREKDEILKKEGAHSLLIKGPGIFKNISYHNPPFSRKELTELVNFLDPNKPIPEEGLLEDNFSLWNGLKTMFLEKGIQVVKRQDLMPHEISMTIDLTVRKRQLLREFGFELDRAYQNLKEREWKPDNSRERKRVAIQMDIWKMRKKKMGFSSICRELKISEDLAKKHFYRAYFLTQGKDYDPEFYRREAWVIKKSDLLKTCKTCKDNPEKGGNCKELCPELMLYVDQDHIKLREKLS